MARLTIVWVKEYAKTNGIFLVKTSTGYAVQYQRLIDELTYEDGIGYKECFKTLKEVKNWIDDQNPVDVLGIDKEAAKEIYEDAKNNRVKDDREDALNNITANTSLRFITAQSLVFGDVEKVISDLSHNRCNALSVFEGIGVLREYTFIHPMTLDRLNEKVNDYLLTLPLEYANKILPETKEEDKEESLRVNAGIRCGGEHKEGEENYNQHPEIKNVEIREYAESIFPYLEITDNKSVYDAIMNWRDSNYFKTPLIKEEEEFLTALPLWELNNSNELNSLKFHKLATEYLAYIERIERKEDMALTKESNAAIRLLVKYDFTTQELTQFEEFALVSLKKYVESGVEPKLIKTFAEVLIKKLSEEEKISLRDKALKKSLKGNRLDDAKEWFKISDILKKEVEELSNDEIHFLLEFLEKNKHLDIKSVPHSMGGAIYRFDLTCYNWHEVLKDKGFFREALYFKAGYGISHEVFNDLIKEKLKRHIGGVLSEEVFLDMCLREGVDDHEASLKWLEFINLTVDREMPEKWEESWEEFKESEEFKELI